MKKENLQSSWGIKNWILKTQLQQRSNMFLSRMPMKKVKITVCHRYHQWTKIVAKLKYKTLPKCNQQFLKPGQIHNLKQGKRQIQTKSLRNRVEQKKEKNRNLKNLWRHSCNYSLSRLMHLNLKALQRDIVTNWHHKCEILSMTCQPYLRKWKKAMKDTTSKL